MAAFQWQICWAKSYSSCKSRTFYLYSDKRTCKTSVFRISKDLSSEYWGGAEAPPNPPAPPPLHSTLAGYWSKYQNYWKQNTCDALRQHNIKDEPELCLVHYRDEICHIEIEMFSILTDYEKGTTPTRSMKAKVGNKTKNYKL